MVVDDAPSYPPQDYLVGVGCYDITGPCAELHLMGYGSLSQRATGIAQRLRARSFVIAHRSADQQRVCLVTCDLWACTQAVKVEVSKRLAKIYGGLYSEANVMISSTHTHSGVGGFSWHALYNISCLGFSLQNFNAIVDGIVQSVGLAHGNMVRGYLRTTSACIRHCGFNRSPEAYQRNRDRDEYASDVEDDAVVLQMFSDQKLLGVITWHGAHCTCLGRTNTLVSGDHKGVASYLLRKLWVWITQLRTTSWEHSLRVLVVMCHHWMAPSVATGGA